MKIILRIDVHQPYLFVDIAQGIVKERHALPEQGQKLDALDRAARRLPGNAVRAHVLERWHENCPACDTGL